MRPRSSDADDTIVAHRDIDGRRITVRPACVDDVDGLIDLYHRLSDTDVQLRFFSGGPSREFLRRWCSVAERGGLLLIALAGAGPGEQVVAEAGYGLRADGDGELGITVAPEFRGLGGWMFDLLLREAATRGIRNIHAVVRTSNRRMIGLVRKRGVVMADWDVDHLDLVVGTSGATPQWPDAGGAPRRPRVLVEAPYGHWGAERAALDAGFDVLTCRGPSEHRGDCPMLTGTGCALAEGCDAVVVAFPEDSPHRDAILAEHLARGDADVIIAAPGTASDDPDATAADVVASIRRSADRRRD